MGAMKKAGSARKAAPVGEFTGFPTAAFTFLKGLADNNNREWFEARRDTYEGALREPMKALIEEMDARLATFAPEITGTVKGSMFRIHRDIRFSKNKAPYKTNAACWFFHRDSKGNVGQEAVARRRRPVLPSRATRVLCGRRRLDAASARPEAPAWCVGCRA